MIARNHLIILLLLELVAVALSVAFAFVLPATVPVHWGLSGTPDAFGPRWHLLVLMPAVGLGLIVLMAVLPRFGPFRENFLRFRKTYSRLLIVILGGLVGLHLVILLAARGGIAIGPALAIVIGVMVALMGNWLGKVRRNFYLGIRTPWTLASEEVWERTHRAGARVFVVWGVVLFVCGLTGSNAIAMVAAVGGAVAVVVWSIAYSLTAYRRLNQPDDLGPEPRAERSR